MEGRYGEGLKDGMKKGMQVGESNKALEIARKMKAAGMDADTIREMTGLDKGKIENV